MMKHGRVAAGLFAALLNPLAGLRPLGLLSALAGIAASLTAAIPAEGAEVPFAEHVISITAAGAFSVFAVDLDGDGDIDVLSASINDDKIAWYENTTPPSAPIPTVSEWGLMVMALLMLTAGTLVYTRRPRFSPSIRGE